MIPRRALLAAAMGGLLAAPLAARAQAPTANRVWRVAVLTGAFKRDEGPIRALEERLAELGYVQGKRGADDLPPAFEAITRQRAQALLVLPESVSVRYRKPIIEFAASRRLPAMYLVENARAAAVYVDKVLKGADPATLPIAQATKFDLIVNLKTAKALGLTLPSSLLLLADRVIR